MITFSMQYKYVLFNYVLKFRSNWIFFTNDVQKGRPRDLEANFSLLSFNKFQVGTTMDMNPFQQQQINKKIIFIIPPYPFRKIHCRIV